MAGDRTGNVYFVANRTIKKIGTDSNITDHIQLPSTTTGSFSLFVTQKDEFLMVRRATDAVNYTISQIENDKGTNLVRSTGVNQDTTCGQLVAFVDTWLSFYNDEIYFSTSSEIYKYKR